MESKVFPTHRRLARWFAAAAVAVTALAGGSAAAQAVPANIPAPLRLDAGRVVVNEVSGVRVHTYLSDMAAAANATHIIETPRSVVVIDPQFLRQYADAARKYVNSLGKPIDRVIITHAHPDHFFGWAMSFSDVPSHALEGVAQIIAAASPQMIANQKPMFGPAIPDVMPAITGRIVPGTTETIDGLVYEYSRVLDAESEEQLLIRLPAIRALVVGDLIYSGVHLWVGMGQFDNWAAAIEKHVKGSSGVDLLLPGHGLPAGLRVADDHIAYLRDAKSRFNTPGMSPQAFKNGLLSSYPQLESPVIIDLYLSFLFKR